jgi:cytochrome b561
MTDPRRDELLRWISKTRAAQHKLLYVIGIMLLVSSMLLFWKLGPGLLALGVTAIVAISGFWITSSHILEWNDKLSALRRTSGG